jgi:CRP-like cAMP-binding protein
MHRTTPSVSTTVSHWLHRAGTNPKADALRTVPAFAGLSDHQLVRLAGYLDEASVDAGETLIREGHFNSTFWIVLEGSVEVTVQGHVRRQIGPGGVFGAPSMFDGLEALATVVTLTPLKALVASHTQFAALASNELVALRLKADIGDRLRSDLHALTERAPGTT